MSVIEESYLELFPEKEFSYEARIRYSDAFKDYNANIKYNPRNNELIISMSRKWNTVTKNIKKGLVQELLLKMFGKGQKKSTLSMDLYHIFLKNTHRGVEKDNVDSYLKESFDRVNDKYMNGMLDPVNLIWGGYSKRTLGRYEYGSDSIIMSKIFENSSMRLLDFVMYHEMLHKKHKYNTKNGRNMHHTREFRTSESKYENFGTIDAELTKFVRYFRIPNQNPSTVKKKQNSILDLFGFSKR